MIVFSELGLTETLQLPVGSKFTYPPPMPALRWN